MGLDTCMGDHKPVYLKFNLKNHEGIVRIAPSTSPSSPPLTTPAPPLNKLGPVCRSCSVDTEDPLLVPSLPAQSARVVDSPKSLKNIPVKQISFDDSMNLKGSKSSLSSIGLQFSIDPGLVDNNHTGSNASSRKSSIKSILIDKIKIVKRVNSESECACVNSPPTQAQSWRTRSVSLASSSISAAGNVNNPQHVFVRSISKLKLRNDSLDASHTSQISLPRLESHHSSSDEDWFEQVEEKIIAIAGGTGNGPDDGKSRKMSRTSRGSLEERGDSAGGFGSTSCFRISKTSSGGGESQSPPYRATAGHVKPVKTSPASSKLSNIMNVLKKQQRNSIIREEDGEKSAEKMGGSTRSEKLLSASKTEKLGSSRSEKLGSSRSEKLSGSTSLNEKENNEVEEQEKLKIEKSGEEKGEEDEEDNMKEGDEEVGEELIEGKKRKKKKKRGSEEDEEEEEGKKLGGRNTNQVENVKSEENEDKEPEDVVEKIDEIKKLVHVDERESEAISVLASLWKSAARTDDDNGGKKNEKESSVPAECQISHDNVCDQKEHVQQKESTSKDNCSSEEAMVNFDEEIMNDCGDEELKEEMYEHNEEWNRDRDVVEKQDKEEKREENMNIPVLSSKDAEVQDETMKDNKDLTKESSTEDETVDRVTEEDENDLKRELVAELFEEVTKELDESEDEDEIETVPEQFEETEIELTKKEKQCEIKINREEIIENTTKQILVENPNDEKKDMCYGSENEHFAVNEKSEATIFKKVEQTMGKTIEKSTTTPQEVNLKGKSDDFKTRDENKGTKLDENKITKMYEKKLGDIKTSKDEIKENKTPDYSGLLKNETIKTVFNSFETSDKSAIVSQTSSDKSGLGNVNKVPSNEPTNPFVRSKTKPVIVNIVNKQALNKPTSPFVRPNSKPFIVNIENAKRQLARPKCFKKLIEINMWDKEKKDKERKDALKATKNKENIKVVAGVASVEENETKTETSRNGKIEHNKDVKTSDVHKTTKNLPGNTVKTESDKTEKDSNKTLPVNKSDCSPPKHAKSDSTTPKRKSSQEGKVKHETTPDRIDSNKSNSETTVISLDPQKLGIREDELIRALHVTVMMNECDELVLKYANKTARLTELDDKAKAKTPQNKCTGEKDFKNVKHLDSTTSDNVNKKFVAKKTATTMQDMLKISKERQLLKKQRSLEGEDVGGDKHVKVLQDAKNNKADKSEGEIKNTKLNAESLDEAIERYKQVKKRLERKLAKKPNNIAFVESYLSRIAGIVQQLEKRKSVLSHNSERKQSLSDGNDANIDKGDGRRGGETEPSYTKATIQSHDNHKQHTTVNSRNEQIAINKSNVKQVDETNENKIVEDNSDSDLMEEGSYNIEEIRKKSVERRRIKLLQNDENRDNVQLTPNNSKKVQLTSEHMKNVKEEEMLESSACEISSKSKSPPKLGEKSTPKANGKLSEENKVKELKRLMMIKKQLQELKNKKNLMEKSESKLKETQNRAPSGNGKFISPTKTSQTAPISSDQSPNSKTTSKIIVPTHMLPIIRLDPCDALANEYRINMMKKYDQDTLDTKTHVDNSKDDFVSALKRQIAQEIKNKVKVSPIHDNYNASSTSPRQQITTSALFELEELRMKKNDIITVYNGNQINKELRGENKRKEPSEDSNRDKETCKEDLNETVTLANDKEEMLNSKNTNLVNTSQSKSTDCTIKITNTQTTSGTSNSNKMDTSTEKSTTKINSSITSIKTTAPASSNYSIFEEDEFMKRYVKPLQLSKNETTNKSEENSGKVVEKAAKPKTDDIEDSTKNIGDKTKDISAVDHDDSVQNEDAGLDESESDSDSDDSKSNSDTDDSESETDDSKENTPCKDAKSNLFEQLQKDFLTNREKYKHVDFVEKSEDDDEGKNKNDECKDDKSKIFEELEKQFYNNPEKYMKNLRDPKNRKITVENDERIDAEPDESAEQVDEKIEKADKKVEETSKVNLFEALEQEFYNNQDKYELEDTRDGKMGNDEEIIEIKEGDDESFDNNVGNRLEVGNKVETLLTSMREEHTTQKEVNLKDKKCENTHEKENYTNDYVETIIEKPPEKVNSNDKSVTSDAETKFTSKAGRGRRRKGQKNVKENRSKRESVENNVDTIENNSKEEKEHEDTKNKDKCDENAWETWDSHRFSDKFLGFKIPEKITAIRKLSDLTDLVISIEQYLARNRTSDIKPVVRNPNVQKAKKRKMIEGQRNTNCSESKNDNVDKSDEELIPKIKRQRDIRSSEESGYGSQQDEAKTIADEASHGEDGTRMKVPLLKISRGRIVRCQRDRKHDKANTSMENEEESDNEDSESENTNEIEENQDEDDDRNKELGEDTDEENDSNSDSECRSTTQTHYSHSKDSGDSRNSYKNTRTNADNSTSSNKPDRRSSTHSEDRDSWEPYTPESLQSVLDSVNNDINDHVQASVKVVPVTGGRSRPPRRPPAPIQQRYDDSDLYKPRLSFASTSKRRRVELT
uniref:Uncharacterized protein n=1 Tax=Cacopsylla melanoneura TaxID=428564 RepID=A0A8D9ESD0_9HEMI